MKIQPFHKKFDPSNLYFIGDMHFQHLNLTRGTSSWEDKEKCRDFDTIEEMTTAVIDSVNQIVPKDAILISVGDICFGQKKYFPELRKRINCETILHVFGNHDDWLRKEEYRSHLTWVGDYLEIFVGSRIVCIFHYPLKSWRDCNNGSYMISGHEHGDMPYEDWEKGIDVGWDVWKRPLSYSEIHEIMSKKQHRNLHHNKKDKYGN